MNNDTTIVRRPTPEDEAAEYREMIAATEKMGKLLLDLYEQQRIILRYAMRHHPAASQEVRP